MARRKSNPDDGDTALSFEEALAGLEEIVNAMEHEQLPLEDLVSHYERGAALLGRCESLLKSARGRIELITLRSKPEGEGDAETTLHTLAPASSEDPEDSDDDDIRLF